jgi:hypothetical protein
MWEAEWIKERAVVIDGEATEVPEVALEALIEDKSKWSTKKKYDMTG